MHTQGKDDAKRAEHNAKDAADQAGDSHTGHFTAVVLFVNVCKHNAKDTKYDSHIRAAAKHQGCDAADQRGDGKAVFLFLRLYIGAIIGLIAVALIAAVWLAALVAVLVAALVAALSVLVVLGVKGVGVEAVLILALALIFILGIVFILVLVVLEIVKTHFAVSLCSCGLSNRFFYDILKKQRKRGKKRVEKRKFRIWFFAVHGILLAGVCAFAFLAVLTERFLPDYGCVLLKYGGIYCPGCGGTRAVLALLCGRPLHAFLCYPPIAAIAAVCLYFEIKALRRFASGDPKHTQGGDKALLIIAGAVLLWFVLHNVLLLFGYDYLGNVL